MEAEEEDVRFVAAVAASSVLMLMWCMSCRRIRKSNNLQRRQKTREREREREKEHPRGKERTCVRANDDIVHRSGGG
jgi:hypothetical protein